MKIRQVAVLGAVAALALTACSSEGSTTTPDPSATSGTGTATGDAREITMWLAGEDTPEELRTWLTDEFATTTGATLNIETVEWGELLPRLQTSIGNPDQTPDVVEIGNTQSPTFTTIGAFTDLTPHLADLGGDKLGPEGFVEAGSVDGSVYAVPYYWGSRYVFYRTDVFEDAGIEVPTTLDEFNAAAKELATDEQSGFWLPGQDWRNGISWVFAHGGDIAVQEGDQWVGQLSSPESIEALTELQDLYTNASKAPKDGEDAEPWTAFNNGDAAMFMAPGWARWSISEDLTENVGAMALPGTDGGAAPVFAGGSNIAISAASPDQDLALEALKLIASEDYQTMLAKNGLGPSNSDYNDLIGDDEFAEAGRAAASNAKLTPASAGWAGVETDRIMEEFFAKIAQGGDVATEAAAVDAALNDALN